MKNKNIIKIMDNSLFVGYFIGAIYTFIVVLSTLNIMPLLVFIGIATICAVIGNKVALYLGRKVEVRKR